MYIHVNSLSLSHTHSLSQFLTMKVEEYLQKLRGGQLWGGEVELVVFSKLYRRSIVVFNQQVNQVQEQIFLSPADEAAGRRPEDLTDPVRVCVCVCVCVSVCVCECVCV